MCRAGTKTFVLLVLSLLTLATAAAAGPRVLEESIDADFAKINDQVPGFGGMFVDADGVVKVYMTDAGKADLLRGALEDGVEILEGRYEFNELQGWRVKLREVLGLGGVSSLDVDEKANRIEIGLVPETRPLTAAKIRHQLDKLGIPRDAVKFASRPMMIPLQTTVQGAFNPVPGGVQINFPGFLCTLGFNVRRPESDLSNQLSCFFVTNDHCSATSGNNDSTPYFQPLAPRFIGTEILDPPFFTGAGCFPGSVCRFSDAILARYEDPAIPCEFGAIARTAPIGSINLDNPDRWKIVAKLLAPVVGQLVAKQGRTTGRTEGFVTQTCVDTGVSGTNIVRLCQAFVQNTPPSVIVMPGDSGSPVFLRRVPPSVAGLVGLLWGGSGDGMLFVFSPIENVERDFGFSLTVF